MPLHYVTGDPAFTNAHTLAIGYNAAGRTETGACEMRLMRQFPAGFADYTRDAKRGRHKTGSIHLWATSTPNLLFLTVRESAVGATRLRYVQTALTTLARDYTRHSITSLALAPLGSDYERDDLHILYERWLQSLPIPIAIYTTYEANIPADEPF